MIRRWCTVDGICTARSRALRVGSTTPGGNPTMSHRSRIMAAVLVLVVSVISSIATGDDLRVKNLPIPEGATDISFMKRRGDIRFKVTSDVRETGDWYAKQLAAQ